MPDPKPTPLEVDVETVARWRSENANFVLLDVREPEEYSIARIEGAKLMPMSEMGDRLGELEAYRDQHVVVHCHHGVRSLRTAEALRERGFQRVQSMAAGIDGWSLQVDPSIPRY